MKDVRISIMAAITDERGLGNENKLLFQIPEDFARMKRLTMGHPIIMGRKTYESIGRPLPGRTNIIITRDLAYNAPGCVILNSLEDAVQLACEEEESRIKNKELGIKQKKTPNSSFIIHNSDEKEVFIFGGGEIFKESMPIVDRLYLTVVHKKAKADTFFPDYAQFIHILEKEDKTHNSIPYTFLTLEK